MELTYSDKSFGGRSGCDIEEPKLHIWPTDPHQYHHIRCRSSIILQTKEFIHVNNVGLVCHCMQLLVKCSTLAYLCGLAACWYLEVPRECRPRR